MDAVLFCNILETTLVPFVREKLPNHCLMQDNDPQRTSKRAEDKVRICGSSVKSALASSAKIYGKTITNQIRTH